MGWAPLPWQVRWRAGVGLDWGGLSVNVALGPSSWYFVQARDLVAPSLRSRIVPAYRNVTLIQITQHVTNYTYIDNRIVDQSVRVEKIGRAVGHTIPRYRVRPAEPSEAAQGGRVRGQDFVVFRPNTVRGAKSQGRLVPPGRERMNRPDEAPQGTPPEATEPKRESSSKPGKTEHQPSRFLRDLEQQRNRTRDARGSAPDQGAVPATPSETRSDGRTPPPRTGPANAQPDKPGQAATPPVKPGQSKSQAATSKAKKPGDAPPKPRKPKPGASDSAGSDSEKPKPETPEPENQP